MEELGMQEKRKLGGTLQEQLQYKHHMLCNKTSKTSNKLEGDNVIGVANSGDTHTFCFIQ